MKPIRCISIESERNIKMQSDFATTNDKINVLVKEKASKLNNLEQQARSINSSLANALANLENVPGVDSAREAIKASIQENYRRGNSIMQVRQIEREYIETVQEAYMKYSQAVDNLEVPEEAKSQLQLDNPINGEAHVINEEN